MLFTLDARRQISMGDSIYFAPDLQGTDITVYVLTSQLARSVVCSKQERHWIVSPFISPILCHRLKGSDASWVGDEEPPPEEIQYSDDEQEAAARAAARRQQ